MTTDSSNDDYKQWEKEQRKKKQKLQPCPGCGRPFGGLVNAIYWTIPHCKVCNRPYKQ